MTRLAAGLVALLPALVFVPAALAHSGGKAEPRIAAKVGGSGLVRPLTVRLTDVDDGDPISRATVTASAAMTFPHEMSTLPGRVRPVGGGVYKARLALFMPGKWTVKIGVSGKDVTSASADLPVDVTVGSSGSPSAGPGLTTLPTALADNLTGRDYITMVVLWIHGLAAMGWIIGVLAMALALSARPGVVAEPFRAQLAAWYRAWGAWLHWSLVPVIVASGIYNLVYVSPFTLEWRPDDLARLASIPYGALYEAILVVKLGLFAALLITGSQVLVRTVHPSESNRAEQASSGFVRTLGSALGPSGLFYLATVPLILAAAMALRYVHILSHVAEVVNSAP
jgi:YtkA-like